MPMMLFCSSRGDEVWFAVATESWPTSQPEVALSLQTADFWSPATCKQAGAASSVARRASVCCSTVKVMVSRTASSSSSTAVSWLQCQESQGLPAVA